MAKRKSTVSTKVNTTKKSNLDKCRKFMSEHLRDNISLLERDKVRDEMNNVLEAFGRCLANHSDKDEERKFFSSLNYYFNRFFEVLNPITINVDKKKILSILIETLYKYKKGLESEKKEVATARSKAIEERARDLVVRRICPIIDPTPEVIERAKEICEEGNFTMPLLPSERRK